MNILFYYDTTICPQNGGIARVTLSLADQFRQEGHCVYFLSAKRTIFNGYEGQYYLPVETCNKSVKNKYYFFCFLAKYNINIIINQNGTTPYKNEAVIWGKEAKIPVITVLHSSLFGLYGIHQEKLNKYHSTIKFFKMQGMINNIVRFYFKLKYRKYYKEQVNNSSKIVLLSERFKNEVKYFSGLDCNNITYIPNPLTIKPNSFFTFKKSKEILFVGRISYEKRVDLLLDIWEALQNKHLDWKLTIVGEGPLKGYMEKKAFSLNLKRVYFEGYKDPTPYYERASIFCLTSAFEGFGLVLVEAMSFGTVPIAFNSYVNVSEIIDDSQNGYLIPPFSTELYASKLSLLIKDENKRFLMAENAINKSKIFKIEEISKKWNELLVSIVNEVNE